MKSGQITVFGTFLAYKYKLIFLVVSYLSTAKGPIIDLSHAKELGLKVDLIQDGSSNALVYEKEIRIPGEVITFSLNVLKIRVEL